jgi:quercetin dioxygenase-like cupin family protein
LEWTKGSDRFANSVLRTIPRLPPTLEADGGLNLEVVAKSNVKGSVMEDQKLEYVRNVDFAALEEAVQRSSQRLLGSEHGITSCEIRCIRTPPGSGSPDGLHTHKGDQVFYILAGTMNFEIAGDQLEAGPGALVVFPARIPHRNWNETSEATIHLAIDLLNQP